MTELRLLGTVEIRGADRAYMVGPAQRRAVFAALAVDANQPVPMDTIIGRVWKDAPPSARDAIYAHLSRIRLLLSKVAGRNDALPRLERHSSGYLLRVAPDDVDHIRFRGLIDKASQAGVRDVERAGLLREALELWRGEPLAGVDGPWAGRVRQGWRQARLEAVIAWAHAELYLGNHELVLVRLSDYLTEYPLAEPLSTVFIRALCSVGRPAQALDHYAELSRHLAEDLGTDPGPELREIHRAILSGDLNLVVRPPTRHPRPVLATGGAASTAPAQLPNPVSALAGRVDELAQLDHVLDSARHNDHAIGVAVLSGMAGVGKTTLALHWAHHAAERFPDGQLYVNLRGYEPSQSPMSRSDAIGLLLEAFGFSQQHLPADLDAQVGLYRSQLASKRLLLVLDNARTAEQVRPLIAGGNGSVVVVTSRNRLTGLVAAEEAKSIPISPLSTDEARALLRYRIGARRVQAEPAAVEEIISRCGRLPLALVLAAARASTDQQLTLAMLSKELEDAAGPLDALSDEHISVNLRAAFATSYDALESEAAKDFRILGLVPGFDISLTAASQLLGYSLAETRERLRRLANANLMPQHGSDRYRMHDLVRQFAGELSVDKLTQAERDAAVRRLVEFYVEAAQTADSVIAALGESKTSDSSKHAGGPSSEMGRVAARAWFSAEHSNLLAIQEAAAERGWDQHVWRLAQALSHFHRWRGRFDDAVVVWSAGLTAAERLQDKAGQAEAHLRLGPACARTGNQEAALVHAWRAAALYEEIGDTYRNADAHQTIAAIVLIEDDYQAALAQATEALRLFRTLDDMEGEASGYNAVGWCQALLGRYDEARPACERALALYRRQGNHHGEAVTLDSLGYIALHTGRHEQALSYYSECLARLHEIGNVYNEAETLSQLAEVHLAMDQRVEAARRLREARELYRSQHRISEADDVQRRIDALGDTAAGRDHPPGDDLYA
ncbi:AfsR/SARP family transcriptional regulator [Flindersiella endophytica]